MPIFMHSPGLVVKLKGFPLKKVGLQIQLTAAHLSTIFTQIYFKQNTYLTVYNIYFCCCGCRLWAVQAGECRRLSREASVWPGEAELQKLLVLGSSGDPEGLQGNAVHQRSQVDSQTLSDNKWHHQTPSHHAHSWPSSLFSPPARWPASRRVTSSARCSRSTWWNTGKVSMLYVWHPNWWRSTWRAPSTRNHQSQVSLDILDFTQTSSNDILLFVFLHFTQKTISFLRRLNQEESTYLYREQLL